MVLILTKSRFDRGPGGTLFSCSMVAQLLCAVSVACSGLGAASGAAAFLRINILGKRV